MHSFGDAATETSEAFCRPCRLAEPPFVQAVAHGLYQGKLRALLHLLKYDGMEPVGDKLGALLARQILTLKDMPPAMTVVPVPLFKAKGKQRGFNQAEVLARAAVKALQRLHPEKKLTVATGLKKSAAPRRARRGLPRISVAPMCAALFLCLRRKRREARMYCSSTTFTPRVQPHGHARRRCFAPEHTACAWQPSRGRSGRRWSSRLPGPQRNCPCTKT
jgi:hypothetical protein